MSTVKDKSDLKRLDNHIGVNKSGHMQWQDCLDLFAQFLETNKSTICDTTATHLYCTHNFELDEESGERRLLYKELEETKAPRPKEAYLSPDHILEAELDQRSQVYSLGAVIYECLSGKPPFPSKNAKVLQEHQIAFDPRPPAVNVKDQEAPLPEPVVELVMKCLSKDPARRYQSFDDLQKALTDTSKITGAPPEETAEIDQKQESAQAANPRPLIVSAAIMLVLTLMIVGTISYVGSEAFKSHIYRTRNKNKNLYLLSLEDSNYRKQMDFKDGKPVPEEGAVPITIVQKKTKKIIFATTQKKTLKEAVEEAKRRELPLLMADLRKADLEGIDLSGAKMMQADFTDANLKNANLKGCELSRASFYFCNLENANLEEARLAFADLRKSNLAGAHLKGSFAARANLENAFLKGADLSNATIGGALLNGANLEGANLDNTMAVNIDWSTTNLTKEQYMSTLEARLEERQKQYFKKKK